MIKKLQELLAQVRDAEKSALAILKSGQVGSKIDGTVQQLRRTAAQIEERIRMLKDIETPAPVRPQPKGAEKTESKAKAKAESTSDTN